MKYIIICLAICFPLCTPYIHTDISKYLKNITDKDNSPIQSIPNIDFIYLINLDQRPKRLERVLQQLHPYGISPYRFSAVNGYAFSLDELNDLGVKLAPGMKTGESGITYYKNSDTGLPKLTYEPMIQHGKTYFFVALGGIGCLISHLTVLQDAYDSNYETIWILEDDIQVIKDPKIISSRIEELDRLIGKENWDVLYTDVDRRDVTGKYMTCSSPPSPARPNYTPLDTTRFLINRPIGSNFRQIGARFGTHSIIVRRSGMEKILRFIKNYDVFLNIDQDLFLTEGIRLYTLTEDIVTNALGGISDWCCPLKNRTT